MLAQLTTNMAANVVSPANDFSSLAPRRISYVTGGLITAAIGIVMLPWKLYADAAAYIFTLLLPEPRRVFDRRQKCCPRSLPWKLRRQLLGFRRRLP